MTLETIQLTEPETNSRATISISRGFNCFEFQTARRGQVFDVLYAQSDFAAGEGRPSGSGIPLLFPFAGRIAGTSFAYQGRTYLLEEGDGQGNAIHGFVLRRAWRVLEQTASRVVGRFHAALDDPALLESWPADFRITVAYELRGGALVCDVTIDNPGETPLPYGFATHAYFRVPPTKGAEADACRVTVPVQSTWELVNLLPTGKKFAGTGEVALAAGAAFGACQLDSAYTDLEFVDGRCTTQLTEPASGRSVMQTFDRAFQHCVVYTPPHRQAICMEPYTALPDPFRLEAEGVPSGLKTLAPGEAFQTQIVIDVR